MSNEDLTPDSIKFLREQIADETLRKAAPALLDALEDITFYGINDITLEKARTAIAAAKGE